MIDVAIIGAGVIGCAIARELSRCSLDICVLERESDVAEGTSKANSGIVHAGYDAAAGTLKAKFNPRGSAMFPSLVKELDVPYKQNGSLVISFSKEDTVRLEKMMENGRRNGLDDLEILNREQVLEICPQLSKKVVSALYAKHAGIVCPYELTVALAENAVLNGVKFFFDSSVSDISRIDGGYRLTLENGKTIEAKTVVNCAGVFADEINNMISENKLKIIPRKGEYCLFDRMTENIPPMTIFQLPNEMGKGVLVGRTVDGNMFVGPNAIEVDTRDNLETTAAGLDYVLKTASLSVGAVPTRQIITSFAGLRAHLESEDFEIGELKDAEGFFNVAGIESPGLSSAPAIGVYVAKLVAEKLSAGPNTEFNSIRHGIPKFREMTNEERSAKIKENPAYGRVVCRCETVTEAEIVDAIHRTPGATTLDGIKRRTRAGMGRCQSGFCTTRLLDILARELNLTEDAITKNGRGSELLIGKKQ